MKIEHKEIDLFSDKWDLEKIHKLSSYIMNNYGGWDIAELYISGFDFNAIQDDLPMHTTYLPNQSGFTNLCVYTSAGRLNIFPTTQMDYIEFQIGGFKHKFNNTNKLKQYKQDFATLLED